VPAPVFAEYRFLIVCPFDLFPHGSRSSLFEPWDPSSKREDWGRRCRPP
jgi:hypothetical protein